MTLRLCLLAGCLASACARQGNVPPPGGPTPGVSGYRYEVVASPGARELTITGTFPRGTAEDFGLEDRGDTFVSHLEVETKDGWTAPKRDGATWDIEACADGCRIRYRYLLGEAAGAWGDIAVATRESGVILAPPSTWLLRPIHAELGTRIRFHVVTASGDKFLTGVFPVKGEPDTYEAFTSPVVQLPYSAFGSLRVHEIGGGDVTLGILPGRIDEAGVVAWAEAAVSAVRGFYGKMPCPHVLVLVRPAEGEDGVGFGTTMGYSGAAIAVSVGSRTSHEAFAEDWVLVHELIHTALPDLPDDQHWLEEGLATYVEPLARYRQGSLTADGVWGDWAKRMAQGEPEQGDEGLNQTHTWGRTYWGGALFCLATDVALREKTHGRASLETVLRGIVGAGGNISVIWPMSRVLEVADASTGTHVFSEKYKAMAEAPAPVDLPLLWKRLGVLVNEAGEVTFDDHAELAWVRNAMTPPL